MPEAEIELDHEIEQFSGSIGPEYLTCGSCVLIEPQNRAMKELDQDQNKLWNVEKTTQIRISNRLQGQKKTSPNKSHEVELLRSMLEQVVVTSVHGNNFFLSVSTIILLTKIIIRYDSISSAKPGGSALRTTIQSLVFYITNQNDESLYS